MAERYLITGGAGFIGINAADRCLSMGKVVTILDNMSRGGAEQNLRWLQSRHDRGLRVVKADLRQDGGALRALVEECDVVLHLAGQVAVTTSVANPRDDFEINALGTLNVLEAVRLSRARPIVVYSSTNKVYGEMTDVAVTESARRYAYAALAGGVPETRRLDFHSPYGCSRGAGDQYTINYARIYGLRTVVFRQSCIYGPRQFGIEDQGWVAWFSIRTVQGHPVTIYGDGKQVRDVLYIDDLLAAYDTAIERIDVTAGQVYNIGGGPAHTLSLLELIDILARESGHALVHSFADWRAGDQRVFVSDIRKAHADFGWRPRVAPADGVARLLEWIRSNIDLFGAA